jgi:hypothetical protein
MVLPGYATTILLDSHIQNGLNAYRATARFEHFINEKRVFVTGDSGVGFASASRRLSHMSEILLGRMARGGLDPHYLP